MKQGERAVIESIDTTDPAVQRLMMLGLVEGTEVEFAGAAIGGDPMELRVFGTAVTLRREQARFFTIAPLAERG